MRKKSAERLNRLAVTGPLRRPAFSGAAVLERGLTLVEIIVVLVIITSVMAWVASKVFTAAGTAKALQTKTRMTSLKSNIATYQLMHSKLPSSLEDLVRCNDNSGGGCINLAKEDELKDDWGQPFKYRVQGNAFELRSVGPDGNESGDDLVEKGP